MQSEVELWTMTPLADSTVMDSEMMVSGAGHGVAHQGEGEEALHLEEAGEGFRLVVVLVTADVVKASPEVGVEVEWCPDLSESDELFVCVFVWRESFCQALPGLPTAVFLT